MTLVRIPIGWLLCWLSLARHGVTLTPHRILLSRRCLICALFLVGLVYVLVSRWHFRRRHVVTGVFVAPPRCSLHMQASQASHIECCLPTLAVVHFGFEERHPALLDAVGNNPIDFPFSQPMHCMAGQISGLDLHSTCHVSLGLSILTVTCGAVRRI